MNNRNDPRQNATDRANTMRAKAMSAAKKRKEEFLGARVPKELRDTVIQKAAEEGIPVSILIRKVLEAAFKEEMDKRRTQVEASTPPVSSPSSAAPNEPTSYPEVLGWESITLNKEVPCSACGRSLNPGTTVTLGLSPGSGGHVVLCQTCKERI